MASDPSQSFENDSSPSGESSGSFSAIVLAILIGLAGVALMAFTANWTAMLVFPAEWSNYLVTAVMPLAFFLFLLLVLVVNPLLRLLAPRLALRRRELAVVLSMWLVGAVVSHHNLIGHALFMAGNASHYETKQGVSQRILFDKQGDKGPALKESLVNRDLFLPREADAQFYSGTGDGRSFIAPNRIPWEQWARPLLFWLPYALVAALFASSLVQVVHRQWSKHELLTYPIAAFANALVDLRPKRWLPDIFYDKIFWLGFGLAAGVFVINGLHRWYPNMIEVPLDFAQTDLLREFNFLSKYCGREAYSLFRGTAYPFLAALAVFLPLEISFTCWFGWILMIIVPGFYFLFSGHAIAQSETGMMRTGMYVAMLAVIIGIGWKEYWNILRHAITFRRSDDAALQAAARACRLFILAFAALVALLMRAGLDGAAAATMACAFALVVILMARMTAEVGFPWLVSFAGATKLLPLKMLGAAALGPKALVAMAVVGVVLDGNTSNSIAAQETTCRKLEEKQARGLPRWAFNLILLVAVLVGLGSGVAANLWASYSFGAQKDALSRSLVTNQLEQASIDVNRLQIEGKATDLPALERFKLIKPEPKFWRFFILGAAILGFVALMRLRFTWWPLHPLPFLLIDTWGLSRLYFTFFIAWLIKALLLRIGGGKVFNRAKPFFYGVIAGQIAAVVLWIIVGIIYYIIQRAAPGNGTITLI